VIDELRVDQLRRVFDPTLMRCETTEMLTPLEEIIGQERAVKALKFGLDIKEQGFNIYVAGEVKAFRPAVGRLGRGGLLWSVLGTHWT
jgi:hypothetical protein